MFSRTLIALCVVLLPTGAFAQCSGMISYTTNCLSAQFVGVVQGNVGPNTMYYWWFDDNGNNSQQLNPQYTFSAGGTYNVSFSFYDPASGCSDSVTIPVTVVPCNCTADFTWIDTVGNTYFISTTSQANAFYWWDFGDGNYSYQQNPSHSYANPGTYNVCLSVYDSMQVFCDSTCHHVTVTGGCVADFTWIDTAGYCFFTSTTSAGPGAMYAWDFGDGGYSQQQNPSYQYSIPGWYMVCFFVYDSNQVFCDSACHSVYVQQVSVEENMLQNSMTTSPNPADDALQISFNATTTGEATVTFYDAAGRVVEERTTPIYQTGFNKIEINTTQMPQGIYLIKLEMNAGLNDAVGQRTVAWEKIALTHQ